VRVLAGAFDCADKYFLHNLVELWV
jgi:hypothetical protein